MTFFTGPFMKLVFLLSLIAFQATAFAIDDSSFKNKDKYQFLKIQPIGKIKEFNIHATFYPPEGKKLNKASYIKVWEKKKKEWVLAEQITPDLDLGLLPEYKLEKKVNVDSTNTPLAVEIEFIHCSLSGGQCAMEKFLGKIERKAAVDQQTINLTLRID